MKFTREVVAIIPAYNEAKTLGDVVRVLRASPFITRVVVVSDGSSDNTADVAKEAGATVFVLSQNRGKGEAMRYGVSKTTEAIIAFFDADLRGLTTKHVEQLVVPVINGDRAMNVGMRDRGPFWTRLSQHLPLISGERALERKVFEHIPPRYLQGFMVENALNYYCRVRRQSYGSVVLQRLTIRHKYQKVSLFLAVIQYICMFVQIAWSLLIVRLAHLTGRF